MTIQTRYIPLGLNSGFYVTEKQINKQIYIRLLIIREAEDI